MHFRLETALGVLGITLIIHPTTAFPSFNSSGLPRIHTSVQQEPLSTGYDALDAFDFWREAKNLGEKATNYAERILEDASNTYAAVSDKIEEIKSTITDIVSKTEALKDEVQKEIMKHNLTLEDISAELSMELVPVFNMLKTEFSEPLPDNKTERYKQREAILNSAMPKIENAFVNCAATWHMPEEDARARFRAISSSIKKVILITGNLIDNHPVLIEVLLFAVSIFIIPEAWLLRPILGGLGFGPAGPIKGSPAAWAQSILFGAIVPKGSWFSRLQQAGMKRGLHWIIIKIIQIIVGIIRSLLGGWVL